MLFFVKTAQESIWAPTRELLQFQCWHNLGYAKAPLRELEQATCWHNPKQPPNFEFPLSKVALVGQGSEASMPELAKMIHVGQGAKL